MADPEIVANAHNELVRVLYEKRRLNGKELRPYGGGGAAFTTPPATFASAAILAHRTYYGFTDDALFKSTR